MREFETTENINSLGQGLNKQIHAYNHLPAILDLVLWNEAPAMCCGIWISFSFDYYSNAREFMWLNFVWVVWHSTFLPISNTFAHTEKPSITKPQNIKTDYNYPLRMHEDIMTLISVSVCHYLLYFFLFPRKDITLLFCSCSLFHYLFSNFLDTKTVPHLNNKSTYPYNCSQESHLLNEHIN